MGGVSSFGFSGTNAHVVLSERVEGAAAPQPVFVLDGYEDLEGRLTSLGAEIRREGSRWPVSA